MKLEITTKRLSLVQMGKVHATHFEEKLQGAVTLCGRPLALAVYLRERQVDDEQFCNKCFRQLLTIGRAYRIENEMPNRKLSVPGVFLSDVAHALEAKDIPLTVGNIEAAATHVELIASACAKAELQDLTREDWLDWIENFSQRKAHS